MSHPYHSLTAEITALRAENAALRAELYWCSVKLRIHGHNDLIRSHIQERIAARAALAKESNK